MWINTLTMTWLLTSQTGSVINNGGWSNYGDWSECSADCGDGTQTRTRTCNRATTAANGGEECQGEDTETRHCNNQSCTAAKFVPSSPYFVHDKSLEFSCVYNGQVDPNNVEWFKGSTDNTDDLITSGEKYTITTGDFNTRNIAKTSVITFTAVAVTDSGDYTCKWTTATFAPKATMTVAIRSLTTPSVTKYSTDGTLKVSCNYEGTTSGTMEWYYKSTKLTDEVGDNITIDGGTLSEDNTQEYTLTIIDVDAENNAGKYSCALYFSDEDKLEAETDVIVRRASTVDSKGDPESSIVVTGSELSARCLFEGDKVPTDVKWYVGDSEIDFEVATNTQNTNTKQLDRSIKHYSNITIKNFAFTDEGSYTCIVMFDDVNEVAATVAVVNEVIAATVAVVYARVSVTNDGCVFVNYRTTTSQTLSCTYTGGVGATAVSFTLPADTSQQAGVLSGFVDGVDSDTAGTQTGSYTVSDITAVSSGPYTCTFTLVGGGTVSAIQRVTARKATIATSAGTVAPELIVRSLITLTCTVATGAKSVTWYKGDSELLDHNTVTFPSSNDLVEEIYFNIQDDSSGDYKCVAKQYDDFCPSIQEFESESVTLQMIEAKPIIRYRRSLQGEPITDPSGPFDAVAYVGGEHIFTCVFPNQHGTEKYEIVWLYENEAFLPNGDFYNNDKELIIVGTINNDGTVSSQITTTLTINAVTVEAGGNYMSMIKWGTDYKVSTTATLTVNAISSPPLTTNVAAGGEAKLTCVTSGGSSATISFHKTSDNSPVTTIEQSDSVTNGVTTTTGVLTIGSVTATDHATDYYCKATWGDKCLTSGSVYLSVLDITEITANVWGVTGLQAQFKCTSNGILLTNANGDPYKVPISEQSSVTTYVIASAVITWEYYDADKSAWKKTSDISRYVSSQTDPEGYRIVSLRVQTLTADDGGLKVRCKTAYTSDADNNFFGGIVISGEMTLHLASLTSMTVSKADPFVGETITFTCVATGESAPKFSLNFYGAGYTWVGSQSSPVSTGTSHQVTQSATADEANTLGGGLNVECKVDYGQGQGQLKEHVAVTTYYDCASVEVKKLNTAAGTTYVATDQGDGTLTQTLVCPSNTATAQYKVSVSESSAEVITCRKDTGMYHKTHMASCLKVDILKSGTETQTLSLDSDTADLKPCSTSATGEWTLDNVIKKLESETDEVCGLYLAVPCLRDRKCTLGDTSCEYEASPNLGRVILKYTVNLKEDWWTFSISERNALTNPDTIQFWSCSETYDRKKRDAEESQFEGLSHSKRKERGSDDSAYSTVLVGGCAVMLVAAKASLFIIRRSWKPSDEIDSESL